MLNYRRDADFWYEHVGQQVRVLRRANGVGQQAECGPNNAALAILGR
jgi:hypothetical protein